ncbi:MAG TPA: ribbon-helix-helix protein, CopG family [Armatimonadota bacterium]|jgi:predicted DNA-binding protein|nr:ribbon-helix-helix protein, CopG family [Armatimonadota bacterium]
MASTSVRVDDSLRDELKNTAASTGQSIADVIRHALELYRAELFFDAADAAYARLQGDSGAWAEELEERRLSENTLMDDLGADEWTE